jgi:hypothetical protein
MGQLTLKKTIVGATFQGSYIAGIYYPDKTKKWMEKWLP